MTKLGIDLGTSNTLVAYLDKEGQPQVYRFGNRDSYIPSVVYFEEEAGNVLIGNRALEAGENCEHKNMYRRWKINMGKTINNKEIVLGNIKPGGDKGNIVNITPTYLSTVLLEQILNMMSDGVGGINDIEEMLITVPHGWRRETPEKCSATKKAANDVNVNSIQSKIKVRNTVSEPVAAAAYWIWERNRSADVNGIDLVGKNVLVCDIGGGTFDLSLVKVNGNGYSLDVIDAINNELAGDFVDALICSEICKVANTISGDKYPINPLEILEAIERNKDEYLSQWMKQAKEVKEKISEFGQRLSRIKAQKCSCDLPNEKDFSVKFGFDTVDDIKGLREVLKPFYEKNRSLLRAFISGRDIHSVVLCGGGSKMYGVMTELITPELEYLFGKDKANEIINLININIEKADLAIAMGAALIANDKVKITERLLYNIGIKLEIDSDIAKELKLSNKSQEVIIMPVLKKGSTLPVTFSSKNVFNNNNCLIYPRNGEFEVGAIIDDGSNNLFERVMKYNTTLKNVNITWELTANEEGILEIKVISQNGKEFSAQGKFDIDNNESYATESSLKITKGNKLEKLEKVSLEQIKGAINNL